MKLKGIGRVVSVIITIVFFTISCGPSQEEYDAQVRRANELLQKLNEEREAKTRLQKQYEDAQKKIAELQAENERMALRLQEFGEDVNRLRAESEEAKKRAEELLRLQRQQEERLKTYCSMLEKFHKMIIAGKLKVKPIRGRLVVELPSAILFESGSAELSKEGKETLSQVAEVLKSIPEREFQIAGHTDDRPIRSSRYPSNWELSTSRAVNVVKFLQEAGVPPQRLSAAGFSEYQPAVPNDSEDNRALNRRIEIILMPNVEELPDLTNLQCNM